jgi:hypothetical protein
MSKKKTLKMSKRVYNAIYIKVISKKCKRIRLRDSI